MGKKHCAIVMATTGNMTFALANVLIGLKKHSPNLADDVIVYEKGMLDKDKQIINQIIPTNFIEYNFDLQTKNNQKNINRFTSLAFARLECFSLLKEYKYIVWFDIDTLIKKDISPILNFANTSGLSIHTYEKYGKDTYNFTQPIEGYEYCFLGNSGILALSDKLENYDRMTDWCYKMSETHKEFLNCAEQGVLSMLIKDYGIDVIPLPEQYNCRPICAYKVNDVRILHSLNYEKFWNFYDCEEWFENYYIWLKSGGSAGKVYRLSVLQQLLYQKTIPRVEEREIRDDIMFIEYLIDIYGRDTVNNAYREFVDIVLKNNLKLNNPTFEHKIKRKYAGLQNG